MSEEEKYIEFLKLFASLPLEEVAKHIDWDYLAPMIRQAKKDSGFFLGT